MGLKTFFDSLRQGRAQQQISARERLLALARKLATGAKPDTRPDEVLALLAEANISEEALAELALDFAARGALAEIAGDLDRRRTTMQDAEAKLAEAIAAREEVRQRHDAIVSAASAAAEDARRRRVDADEASRRIAEIDEDVARLRDGGAGLLEQGAHDGAVLSHERRLRELHALLARQGKGKFTDVLALIDERIASLQAHVQRRAG